MSPPPETTSRRGLVVGLALGTPVMAYGVQGALVDAQDTRPVELASWVVGSALANDLVVVPLVLAVGAVTRRVTPRAAWPAVRTGLIVTGALCLVAWPFVRGYGRDPRIPSLLDRNYAAGLAMAVAVVWALVAAWLLVSGRRVTTRRPPGDVTPRD